MVLLSVIEVVFSFSAYNAAQAALTKLRHEQSVNSCETEWALSDLEVANKVNNTQSGH